jgi:hypothetical protein
MSSRWRKSLLRRAFEEAIYALFETRERAMIAGAVAIVAIAAIWLMGGHDIAWHELIIKLSASAGIILFFPFVWGWKFLAIQKKSFQIILGGAEPYTTIESSGANLTRTVRVMIKNNTLDEISNGNLHILQLDPPNNGYGNFLLDDHITLGPNKSTFIEVASYNEGTAEAAVGSWITLIIPNYSGYFMPATFGRLPVRSHEFHLTFSSLDGILDEIYCRLFVDSDHVLHLEEWI